jgi:protein subunit release factor B
VKVLDYQDGEAAGIKQATFEVDGEFAFGMLKGRERRASLGAHQPVR